MNYQLTGHLRKLTNEQLLEDLKTAAKSIGKNTISNKTYREIGQYYPSIYMRRFKTWNNALKAAGLQVARQYNITVPKLLANILQLWNHLGRQPHLSDLHPPLSQFGRRPYLRAFGTWGNALQQFVTITSQPQYKINPNLLEETTITKITTFPAPKRYINWRLRHLILKNDNYRCRACGASPATNPDITLHIDHIIPASKGGPATPENLQTLCNQCNIGKSNL